ncbi:hypothetical protein ACF05R_00920 [Streptomyces albidoflavus]
MSAPTPPLPRPPRSPVVLRDGRWWLAGRAGTVPVSDPEFTTVLDDFAQAVADADRAVAALGARPTRSPESDSGGQP